MAFVHNALDVLTETVLDKIIHFQPKSYCPSSQFLRQPKSSFWNCGAEHNNQAARVRRLWFGTSISHFFKSHFIRFYLTLPRNWGQKTIRFTITWLKHLKPLVFFFSSLIQNSLLLHIILSNDNMHSSWHELHKSGKSSTKSDDPCYPAWFEWMFQKIILCFNGS